MGNLISANMSVSELIDSFESGDIAVPEIQRDVVWDPEQVKQLIDSISRGFPCGSLILWEPREKDKSLVRSMMRPERLERLRKSHGALPRRFILDGQQRLTALACVMLKRDKLKELLAEMEEELAFIFINLRHFPREIEATTDVASYRFPWVLLNRLFDGSLQDDPGFQRLASADRQNVNRHATKLLNYQFPVQIISDSKYEEVAEIFTRVNSEGTRLTGAEIHLARIVPHWRGITRQFRDYRTELRQKRYDLDLTFLMRAITVVACRVPRIKKLAEQVSEGKLSSAHLNKTWKRARGATNKLIRLLQGDLFLDKSKFFTSKNALVPLVYYLAEDSSARPAARDVERFFLLSQLSERYGGGAETALARDFRTLCADSNTVRQGLSELVDDAAHEARWKYRRLKIKANQVKGLPSKNVLLLMMYVLMRRREATDWGRGAVKSLDEIEPEKIQLHHIFPFNFMIKNRPALKSYEEQGRTYAELREDVNDITNLTFLSQGKNGDIGDTPPLMYLPNETSREMRRSHFIPEGPDLWKPENFADFLKERQKLLAKAINGLLNSLA
jgi:hypothetical protein